MRRGGVGADDKYAVGILDLGNGIGHGSTAKGGGKTYHRGGVSEPGAVVDVVGPHCGSGKFHDDVVFLVGHLGRGQKSDAVTAVGLLDLFESGGGIVQGFIPGCFN